MKHIVALAAGLLLAGTAIAQQAPKNLQVFPKDTPRSELIPIMRQFSFATGLRCEGCHYDPVGNGSFRDIDFASDENPRKETARFMMRMLRNLNEEVLPQVPNGSEPSFKMTCKTCHRGQAKPLLLGQDLLMTVHESGADSAAARYRFLRSEFGLRGAYDFGELETINLAEELMAEGRVADALVILQVHEEFNPDSGPLQVMLGGAYEAAEENAKAIAAYERALELGVPARQVQEQLDALRTKN